MCYTSGAVVKEKEYEKEKEKKLEWKIWGWVVD